MDLCTIIGAACWFDCLHGKSRTELADNYLTEVTGEKACQDDRHSRRESNPRPVIYDTRRVEVPTVAYSNEVLKWTFLSATLRARSIRRILYLACSHSPVCSYSSMHTILYDYTTFMNTQRWRGGGTFVCNKMRIVYIAFPSIAFTAHYTMEQMKNCVQYITNS
jgi:hypothetical protein